MGPTRQSICCFKLILCFSIVIIFRPNHINGYLHQKNSSSILGQNLLNTDALGDGKLIFEDNFETLNLNTWSYDPNNKEHEDEFQLYTNRSENSYVKDGILHIQPTIDIKVPSNLDIRNNFHPIRSARISTKKSFSFIYGTIEIRARLPLGDWLFPALWLMPSKSVYGAWPCSGEIDIMESRGNRNLTDINGIQVGAEQFGSTLHFGPSSETDAWRTAHFTKNDESNENFGSDFHIYKFVWSPDNITFYIDEEDVGTVSPPDGGFWEIGNFSSNYTNLWINGTKISPFDQKFYLIINLAVGGTHFFSDMFINEGGKPWNNTSPNPGIQFWDGRNQWLPTWNLNSDAAHFLIDYVKIWSL